MPQPRYNMYGDQRPPYSYRSLTALAIWSAPGKTVRMADICRYYCDQFVYYRRSAPGWQKSVQKTLVINKCFMRLAGTAAMQQRSRLDKMGVYWTLHPFVLQQPIFADTTLLWTRNPFRLVEYDVMKLDTELVDLDNTLTNIQRILPDMSTAMDAASFSASSSASTFSLYADPNQRRYTAYDGHAAVGSVITNAPPVMNNGPFYVQNFVEPVPVLASLAQQTLSLATVDDLLFNYYVSIMETIRQANGDPAIVSQSSHQQDQFHQLQIMHQLRYLGY